MTSAPRKNKSGKLEVGALGGYLSVALGRLPSNGEELSLLAILVQSSYQLDGFIVSGLGILTSNFGL